LSKIEKKSSNRWYAKEGMRLSPKQKKILAFLASEPLARKLTYLALAGAVGVPVHILQRRFIPDIKAKIGYPGGKRGKFSLRDLLNWAREHEFID
jgi:hypothetical protein